MKNNDKSFYYKGSWREQYLSYSRNNIEELSLEISNIIRNGDIQDIFEDIDEDVPILFITESDVEQEYSGSFWNYAYPWDYFPLLEYCLYREEYFFDKIIKSLKKDEYKIYKIIKENPKIRSKEISKIANIPVHEVRDILSVLDRKKLISFHIANGNSKYTIAEVARMKKDNHYEEIIPDTRLADIV